MSEATKFVVELDTNSEDWEWEDAHEELKAWGDDAGVSHFMVEGKAMGWTRADGFTVVPWDIIPDALSINSDYRVEFTLTTGEATATAVRYSHDEPTGASFVIRPATEDEIENYA